jgi:hypothetical protein
MAHANFVLLSLLCIIIVIFFVCIHVLCIAIHCICIISVPLPIIADLCTAILYVHFIFVAVHQVVAPAFIVAALVDVSIAAAAIVIYIFGLLLGGTSCCFVYL